MAGIFISYRRSDTLPWAGRLFDDLTRSFGKQQVFMDINGGIPRGANFEKVLTESLAGCDAMLALIGPTWATCARSDGTPRLAVPGDWVRNEIATALRRGVPLVPVLLGGARLPDELAMPDDLRGLSKRQTGRSSPNRLASSRRPADRRPGEPGAVGADRTRATSIASSSASTGCRVSSSATPAWQRPSVDPRK